MCGNVLCIRGAAFEVIVAREWGERSEEHSPYPESPDAAK